MCGIIGYTGPKELVGLLMDGLATLEYRGYDSAGVALGRGGAIRIEKRPGKLRELREHLAAANLPAYTECYGLGHTRWATHGAPNEVNAHPHRDCTGEVFVIHNGIIENYAELKDELLAQGHRFDTQTDTEVVAHLIEKELGSGPGGLAGAVRRSVARLRGAYSLVCVTSREPGLLVAARNGPPLVVGFGEGEGFVASDIPALLPHTRIVAALGDREMAVVTRERQELLRFDGTPATFARQEITWDVTAVEKGGHPHFMLKEIMEQPQALRETILSQISKQRDDVLLPPSAELAARLPGIRDVTLVACGTSWHATLVGKFYIERLARLPVSVDVGSEYRYRHPVADERSLVVFVTQSGETADTLAALREARGLGALTLAITNVQGSMATREAHASIVTKAGPEIGVASTKTFTAQMATLYLLALALGRRRGTVKDVGSHLDDLVQLPHLVERGLYMLEAPIAAIGGTAAALSELARRYASARDCLFLGRGLAYPIALEGALKLKEISYIHAEGYPAGEMKHGPIALIDDKVPVVALVPADALREKMMGNIQEVRARGGIVLAVGEAGDLELARVAQHVIQIPRSPELLAPIVLTIPMQLFAYRVAVERGCDVDQPRNLAKSVTVE